MPSRELGRKSLVLFSSTWATSTVGMAVSVAVARRLGPDAVGSLGFSLGLAGIFMAAMLPGFGFAHLKRLSEGQDPGRCIGTMAVIQGALTSVFLTALVVGWSWSDFRLVGSPLATVFGFMLAAQIVSSFSDIPLRVFVAREWVVAHGMILLGGRLLRAALTVLVLVLAPDVVWVAATFTLEASVNGTVAMVVLISRGVRVRAPTRHTVRSYWEYARPLLVTSPVSLFQDSVDRFLVGRWAGLAAAGYYHVARALWEVLGSLLAAPITLLFTRLSALYTPRSLPNDATARMLFESALDKILFVVVPAGLSIWVLAESIVSALYGGQFSPAATAVRILVVAGLVEAIVSPYGFVLYALGAGARLVPLNVVRALLYVAALWLLVPPGGPLTSLTGLPPADAGAAVARVVLAASPAWLCWRWTREMAGIGAHRALGAYATAFGTAVFVHVVGFSLLGPGAGPAFTTAVTGAAAFMTYLLLLFSLHSGARENLLYLRMLLSPPRLAAFLAGRRGGV